jgi:hypothetical protein
MSRPRWRDLVWSPHETAAALISAAAPAERAVVVVSACQPPSGTVDDFLGPRPPGLIRVLAFHPPHLGSLAPRSPAARETAAFVDALSDGGVNVILDACDNVPAQWQPVLAALLKRRETRAFGNLLAVLPGTPRGPRSSAAGASPSIPATEPVRTGEGSSCHIWVPYLEPGSGATLSALHRLLSPERTVPVVPFPTADPRLTDDTLVEYGEFLSDLALGPSDVLYASDHSPRDSYRQVVSLVTSIRRPGPAGGRIEIRVFPGSSGPPALGFFLAAYECDLALDFAPGPGRTPAAQSPPYYAWIAGSAYEPAAT